MNARVLFVSNGHGESAIVDRLARELRGVAGATEIEIDHLPLVGDPQESVWCRIVGPRQAMPSGGLVAMGNVRAFASDVRAGFFRLARDQVRFLRSTRTEYACRIAVGDVFALALALVGGPRALFVGTAKSVYVAAYGPGERMVLRRAARVFVRDRATAAVLRSEGVHAEAPGNTIVDLLARPAQSLEHAAFGVLPGSRAQAYADGVALAAVLRELARTTPVTALFSIAPTCSVRRFHDDLASAGWSVTQGDDARYAFVASAPGITMRGWDGDIGALLGAVDVVLGQAGTANEAAAALGLPIVALAREGGSDAWYRMRQRRLLGDALAIVPPDPPGAAAALAALLADEPHLRRMRAAGRERMGEAGGARAIASAILYAVRYART